MVQPRQQTPFLPTSKNFPLEPNELSQTLTKSWTEIALSINSRVVSIYDIVQNNTGERWPNADNTPDSRQAFRTVYFILPVAPAANIPAGTTRSVAHGLTGVTEFLPTSSAIVNTDGTDKAGPPFIPDWRTLSYVDVTDVLASINWWIDDTNINISIGANSANVLSATVVLEYLLN